MKRLFDLMLVLCALCIFLVPIILVALAVHLTSRGPERCWRVATMAFSKCQNSSAFASTRLPWLRTPASPRLRVAVDWFIFSQI